MNAHDCCNRLKNWISLHRQMLTRIEEPNLNFVDVNELIDELNQMEFDESGDEE